MNISDTLSVIAIIVSAGMALWSIIQAHEQHKKDIEMSKKWQELTNKSNEISEKMNKINLISNFYLKIYIDYLVTEIPKAREELDFYDKKLIGYERLAKVLDSMICSSLYFKFTNPSFFEKLSEKVENLQNYMSDFANNAKSSDQRTEAMPKIQSMISEIYELINNSFLNAE